MTLQPSWFLPCTSMTMRAPSVILAILDSDPRTSVTTSSICFLHLARYGPMKPLVIDWETSVVQWIWEAASTTWPGHCRTHSLRGTVGYCFTALIITCRKLSFITSSTCSKKCKVKCNLYMAPLAVGGNVKSDLIFLRHQGLHLWKEIEKGPN